MGFLTGESVFNMFRIITIPVSKMLKTYYPVFKKHIEMLIIMIIMIIVTIQNMLKADSLVVTNNISNMMVIMVVLNILKANVLGFNNIMANVIVSNCRQLK